jgi:simple sugar transport system ATP-binding protein
VGTQQRVEILKTLYRGAELLILDEPTAVLTPQETVELFEILKTLKKQGKSIIFITHKLEEVMAISDQVTVMRLGKVTMTKATKDTNIAEIARSMVGREVFLNIKRGPYKPGADILEVKNLWAGDDRGLLALKGLDFAVRSGEIVGIAGVAGNGQTELVEVLAGLRPSLAGEVVVEGKNVTNGTPLQVREAGVAHIPEDR